VSSAGTVLEGLLASLAEADEGAKRELANHLRPYLADDPGRLLNANEKARQLGLHPDTIVRMARAGRIEAVKSGRAWRFWADRSEILPAGGSRTPLLLSIAPVRRSPRVAVPASVAAIRGTPARKERGEPLLKRATPKRPVVNQPR
jgi:excisionase family DNA binding protein